MFSSRLSRPHSVSVFVIQVPVVLALAQVLVLVLKWERLVGPGATMTRLCPT